jgi:hypothetical protein
MNDGSTSLFQRAATGRAPRSIEHRPPALPLRNDDNGLLLDHGLPDHNRLLRTGLPLHVMRVVGPSLVLLGCVAASQAQRDDNGRSQGAQPRIDSGSHRLLLQPSPRQTSTVRGVGPASRSLHLATGRPHAAQLQEHCYAAAAPVKPLIHDPVPVLCDRSTDGCARPLPACPAGAKDCPATEGVPPPPPRSPWQPGTLRFPLAREICLTRHSTIDRALVQNQARPPIVHLADKAWRVYNTLGVRTSLLHV